MVEWKKILKPLIGSRIMNDWFNFDFCFDKVMEDGENIKYVKVQTPEICMCAVQTWEGALKYIKPEFKTRKLLLAAIRCFPMSIQFIEDQTEEYCIKAIKGNRWALEVINNQTISLIDLVGEICEKNGGNILPMVIKWEQFSESEHKYLMMKYDIRREQIDCYLTALNNNIIKRML